VLDLVLLRHGRSEWNELNLFTGWHDVDLTDEGVAEAQSAGRTLAAQKDLALRVVHTSLLTRAIRTANIALHAANRSWLPVTRDWRLNERHYGDLTGKNKKQTAEEFGAAQVKLWRRSYDIAPPPLAPDDERSSASDPRYHDLDPALIPATECLKDVVARTTPYFHGVLLPDLRRVSEHGAAVLVAAHGNSLRALRMMIEGISPDDITELEIPTGMAFRYRLTPQLGVVSAEYLGDPAAAAAAAEAVGRQAG
jgi:2,3-bisphosphoglycerate-dependent phosphoglycerate mutase